MAAATAPSGTPGAAACPARPASCSRHIGHRRELSRGSRSNEEKSNGYRSDLQGRAWLGPSGWRGLLLCVYFEVVSRVSYGAGRESWMGLLATGLAVRVELLVLPGLGQGLVHDADRDLDPGRDGADGLSTLAAGQDGGALVVIDHGASAATRPRLRAASSPFLVLRTMSRRRSSARA